MDVIVLDIKITIDKFEGPFDLLLHLIKESSIDISDISIEEVTKQYLNYIKSMEKLNLSIASEYIVMACELIEIKSRMLLPKQIEENSDEYEEDLRLSLINKLLEYKKYKETTSKFRELETIRKEYFTKEPDDLKDFIENKVMASEEKIPLSLLLETLEEFLKKEELKKPKETKITTKEISIAATRLSIIKKLKVNRKTPFVDLFDNINKAYIIVTFLTILEMAKANELLIIQDNNFDQIYLTYRGGKNG